MISWTESASVSSFSSSIGSRKTERLVTSSRTFTSPTTVEDGTGLEPTTLTSTAFIDQTIEIVLSSSENITATTIFNFVSRSTEQEFTGQPSFTDSRLTSRFTEKVLWDNTFTSQIASITLSATGTFVGAEVLNIGTVFQSTTRSTLSAQTSTTTSESRSLIGTRTVSSTTRTWASSSSGDRIVFVSGSQSVSTIATSASATTLVYATTTNLTDTHHVAARNNTVYQAQTDAVATNNQREILWVAPTSGFVAPYRAAADVATSTTRTTISAAVDLISIAPTWRPSATSLWRENFTNESIAETINAANVTGSQRPETTANYFQFPPVTSTGQVGIFSTTSTSYAFTHAASSVVLVDYAQSTTKEQWFTSVTSYLANFPGAQHARLQTIWQSRSVTTSTQNKYFENFTRSNSETLITGETTSETISTSETQTIIFDAGGSVLADTSGATLGTSSGHLARMSVFSPVGAALETASGFAFSINFPIPPTVVQYTALDRPSVRTVFPVFETFKSGQTSYSLSIYGKSATYTQAAGTTTTSQSGQFQAVGQTAAALSLYAGRLGGATDSYVLEVMPGAYKTLSGSNAQTVTTSGGLTNASTFIDSSRYAPISFMVPQTQAAPALIWTAPRNTTNTLGAVAL
jgi:hypothetical protein